MEQLDLFAELAEPATPTPEKTITLPKPTAGQWAPTPAKPPQPAPTPAAAKRPRPEFALPPTSGPDFGERVATAWHHAHGGNRMEIPLGIVATLALWPLKEHPRTLADFFRGLDAGQLLQCVREVAAYWWMRRPDLIDTASVLFSWAEEDNHPASLLAAIRATFHAALDAHALDHTGHADPGSNAYVDLMSWAVTNLRHNSARQGLGEYHTPPEVCDMMAAQIIGRDPEQIREGYSLLDPCAGTGGMFRAAAELFRSMGLDPANYTWFAQEIDPLAAAGCAVNMIVWGLGPNAMVACGDTLAQGDLWNQAVEHRRKLVKARDDVRQAMVLAEALGRVEQLVSRPKVAA
ncbi:N-6 DNA methylase [Streptomyces sp. NPDC005395]|uniref:N-6 DNA methylase n=1 Tax=unclassified Streptomyces TaxID=2593676 RepID=UPI001F2337B1|nr:N-6 DNA methylase [Streptomyces sp. BSE6.1]